MAENEIDLTDQERQPCEIWTRVMGYHRPVSEYNKGKKNRSSIQEYISKKKRLCGQFFANIRKLLSDCQNFGAMCA